MVSVLRNKPHGDDGKSIDPSTAFCLLNCLAFSAADAALVRMT